MGEDRKKADLLIFSHQETSKSKPIFGQETKLDAPLNVNNSFTSVSSKKIGRNEICFCGSGKKYKNCCIDLSKREEDPLKLEVLGIVDSRIKELQNYLRDRTSEITSHREFAEIAQELGSLGHPTVAIKFLKKALDLSPKNFGYMLNYAVMLDQTGEIDQALEVIENIPEGTERKTIIQANIKRKMLRWEEVEWMYEKAAREEPRFYLPYLILIENQPLYSETRDFWTTEGLKNCPTDPDIALHWVMHKFERNEFDAIVEKQLEKRLFSKEGDNSIIGQRHSSGEKLKSVQLICAIAKEFLNQRPHSMAKFANKLDKLHPSVNCRVRLSCCEAAINQGEVEALRSFSAGICADCMVKHSLEEWEFKALENTDREKALEIGKKIFELGAKNDWFYPDYLSLLDDMGYTRQAFELGLGIEDAVSDIFAQARYLWDMSNYASRIGEWGAAEIFLDRFLLLDQTKLLNFFVNSISSATNQYGFFHNCVVYAAYNKCIFLLAKKKLVEFDEYLSRSTESEIYKKAYANNSNKVFIDKTNKEITSLREFVKDNIDKNFFSNLFSKRIEQSEVFSDWGGKLMPFERSRSTMELLKLQGSSQLSDKVSASLHFDRMIMRDQNDYSDILNAIEFELHNVRIIPNDALVSLIEGETRFRETGHSLDCSPTILAYSKSLELTLRHLVFAQFSNSIIERREELIDKALTDKNLNQYRGFINFLKTSRIELGAIHQTILLSKGKTAGRVELLGKFNQFLQIRFPTLLEDDTLSSLKNVSSKFRNEAVHERTFAVDELSELRSLVFKLMGQILALQQISSTSEMTE